MSSRTAFLGKLLGLYLVAVSLSMFAHEQATVEIMTAIIQDPPLLFIAGLMGVTAGLGIVLATMCGQAVHCRSSSRFSVGRA